MRLARPPRRSPLRRLARAGLVVALLAALALGAVIVLAKRRIDAIDPALPSLDALRAFAAEPDLPVRVSLWNSASQPMPRAQVLDPSRDPAPDAAYRMSHPSFVVEWSDGRTLLVDAGMDAEEAIRFGRPIEWLGGGAIEAHGSIAERVLPGLGARPLAIVFTHLHTDHVGAVSGVCRVRERRSVRLIQLRTQAEIANHTTRPGRALLGDARCLAREVLDEAAVVALPGHPGAFLIHAAGHTPGSQIAGAFVREGDGARGYLFAGDVANAIDGIRHGVPKPWAYRTFVVPESETRLARVRALLRDAEREGFVIAISHDERHLASTGIPRFGE